MRSRVMMRRLLRRRRPSRPPLLALALPALFVVSYLPLLSCSTATAAAAAIRASVAEADDDERSSRLLRSDGGDDDDDAAAVDAFVKEQRRRASEPNHEWEERDSLNFEDALELKIRSGASGAEVDQFINDWASEREERAFSRHVERMLRGGVSEEEVRATVEGRFKNSKVRKAEEERRHGNGRGVEDHGTTATQMKAFLEERERQRSNGRHNSNSNNSNDNNNIINDRHNDNHSTNGGGDAARGDDASATREEMVDAPVAVGGGPSRDDDVYAFLRERRRAIASGSTSLNDWKPPTDWTYDADAELRQYWLDVVALKDAGWSPDRTDAYLSQKIQSLMLGGTTDEQLVSLVREHLDAVEARRAEESMYEQNFLPDMEEYDWMRFDPYSFSGAPLGGWGRATRSRLATLPIRLVSDLDGGGVNLLDGSAIVGGGGGLGGPGDDAASDENGRAGVRGNDAAGAPDDGPGSPSAKPDGIPGGGTASNDAAVKDLPRPSAGTYVSVRDNTGRRYVCRSYDEDELMVQSRLDSAFRPADTMWNVGVRNVVGRPRLQGTANTGGNRANDHGESGDAEEAAGVGDGASANEPSKTVKAAAVGAKMESSKGNSGENGGGRKNDSNNKDPKTPTALTPPRMTTSEIHSILRKLDGLCSGLQLGWWSYRWCHEEDVRQFHVAITEGVVAGSPTFEVKDETMVGKYNGDEVQIIYPAGVYAGELKQGETQTVKFDAMGNVVHSHLSSHSGDEDWSFLGASLPRGGTPDDHRQQAPDDGKKRLGQRGPIVRQAFEGGEYCPEAKRGRHMSVELRCCTEDEIHHWLGSETGGRKGWVDKSGKMSLAVLMDVQEDETCVYRARVCTPLLCPKAAAASGSSAPTVTAPAERGGVEKGGNPLGRLLRAIFGDELADMEGGVQMRVSFADAGIERAFANLVRQAEAGRDFEDDPNFQMVKDAIANTHSRSKLNVKASGGVGGDSSRQNSVMEVKDGESIREILAKTLGKRPCLTKNYGWWTYEFCHAQRITQHHENNLIDANTGLSKHVIETQHLLGQYEGSGNDVKDYPNEDEQMHVIKAKGSIADQSIGRSQIASGKNDKRAGGNGAVYVQEYMHGDVCDHEDVAESVIKGGNIVEGGVERSSTVRFSCGKGWELIDVKEDSTCHYIVDVTVPELCRHKLFMAPVTKTRVVKCLPV